MPDVSLDAAVRVGIGSLDLDVAVAAGAGETVAVLGPNGAGKTTLLRALAGLVALDSGRVVLDREVLDEPSTGTWVAPEQRSIGYVFQDYLLFPHLSVLENVAFGPRSRGTSRHEARRVAVAMLDRFGIADRAGDLPSALSGGQAQRVALARALAVAPRLLLLDEPLAALDAGTRRSVRSELRRHLADTGGVRLLVTHDPVDALVLADRLVIVEGGGVVQVGTPADIARHPRSEYVAHLAGRNLYRGRGQGRLVRLDAGGELHLASPAPDGPCLATVDPGVVAIYEQPPRGTPRNVWPGTVDELDVRFDRVRVHVDGVVPVVAEITPEALAQLGLRPGSAVWTSVKATEVDTYPA